MVKVALKIKDDSLVAFMVQIIQSGMKLNQGAIGKIVLRQVVKDLKNLNPMWDLMRELPSKMVRLLKSF